MLRVPRAVPLSKHLIDHIKHLALMHPSNWRMYATRPGANDRYRSSWETVLAARNTLRHSQPVELLRVAGVSFEDRQDNVAQLHPGQALAFVKEPENPYDPHAVAVHTLDARPLGYVPKNRTNNFVHSLCFGCVKSVGQADGGGLWGLSAEVQPRIPPATVLPVPVALRGSGQLDVASKLRGAAWEAARAEILNRSGGRCYITSAETSEITERWEVLPQRTTDSSSGGVFRLAGFAAQAPEVTRIQHMLETGEDLAQALRVLNGWSDEDAATYLKHVTAVAEEYSGDAEDGQRPWTVDVSLLREKGIEIPKELESFA